MAHAGAQMVHTADDAFNPSLDPDFPGVLFPLPGPGMFAAAFRKLMHPNTNVIACAGKGGDHGGTFMMEAARSMLQKQGHNGDRSKILMVGDRFDTDVSRAACGGRRGRRASGTPERASPPRGRSMRCLRVVERGRCAQVSPPASSRASSPRAATASMRRRACATRSRGRLGATGAHSRVARRGFPVAPLRPRGCASAAAHEPRARAPHGSAPTAWTRATTTRRASVSSCRTPFHIASRGTAQAGAP